MSDFLEIAYKHNRVRDVREAFIEYPVEEEWHDGKIENIIEEQQEDYSIDYEIGDIVFVKEYQYSNEESGRNHLFVIIDQDNTIVPIESFGMLISSNLNKLKFTSNKLLKKDKENNLRKNSLVKTDIVYQILSEQIEFKIGTVDISSIEQYKKSFLDIVKNDKS